MVAAEASEPEQPDKIVNLPIQNPRKTPKQLAKAFYDGTLTQEDRVTMGPGMRSLIALAENENERATTARRAALKDLSELAELARDQDGATVTHTVEIVQIRSIQKNIAIVDDEQE